MCSFTTPLQKRCCKGASRASRRLREEAGAKYCPLKLTRAMSAGELAQELRAELAEGTPEGGPGGGVVLSVPGDFPSQLRVV